MTKKRYKHLWLIHNKTYRDLVKGSFMKLIQKYYIKVTKLIKARKLS